jgi:hypothetical protein
MNITSVSLTRPAMKHVRPMFHAMSTYGVRQKNSSTVNCVHERTSPVELRITMVYEPVSSGKASLIRRAV